MMNPIPEKNAKALAKLALDEDAFLRPNGITMTHVSESIFDPANAEGAGGIWMYWQTLVGEGLIANGQGSKVADFVKAQLDMLVTVFGDIHQSAQFYHSDEAQALSEKGHLNGIAPLYLIRKLMGVTIPAHNKVILK